MLRPAVFFDRDGTLIEEVNYLNSLEDIHIFQESFEAIRILNQNGFLVLVLTNQSGVSRGFFNEDFVRTTHRVIERHLMSKGGKIHGWYYCPHHPQVGDEKYRKICRCRKPGTGMIEKAIKDNPEILLKDSFMVGDSLIDLETGWNANIPSILVLTGKGKRTLKEISRENRKKIDFVAKDILDASKWIINQLKSRQKGSS